MTTMRPSATAAPGSVRRYPGLESFQDDPVDRGLFFGRDDDVYELLQLVLAERLVVLFSRSGIGKSSLINAGLMQPLRERGCFPMVVRVSAGTSPLESLHQGLAAACQAGVAARHIDSTEPDLPLSAPPDNLWVFFKTFCIWKGDDLLKPVLVLDQFEELFTVSEATGREALVGQLIELIKGNRPPGAEREGVEAELSDRAPDVTVVISMREEFLAQLEALAERLPAVLNTRYRLGPLGRAQATRAIEEPARVEGAQFMTPPFDWEKDALDQVLSFLARRKAAAGLPPDEEAVEPFQLQLVCRHVESLVASGDGSPTRRRISAADIGGERALEHVLQRFYEDALDAVKRRFPGRRMKRQLRDFCEYELISGAGRRRLCEESSITDTYKFSPALLAELVRIRLIRKEPRVGDNYYELAHDTLIDPILSSRHRREQRRSRLLWMLVPASLALLVATGLWFFLTSEVTKNLERLRSEQEWDAVVPAAGRTGLSPGDTRQSALGAFDWSAGVIVEAWDLTVDGKTDVTVHMESSEFDPQLIVATEAGLRQVNDDGKNGLNSEVGLSLEQAGTVRILATSFSGRQRGRYTLRIDPFLATLTRGDLASASVLADVPRTGAAALDAVTSGTLGTGDAFRGLVLQSFTLPSAADGSTLNVRLSSADFDAYLVVMTPGGSVQSDDDSGDDNRGAALSFPLDEGGDYRVFVTSYSGDAKGQYRLELTSQATGR
ncbi:MAG: hypothetical protein HOP14_14165 [Acidobacteria bacterium]|nr:hypothetical protein [Acidobacteriota bacterium]